MRGRPPKDPKMRQRRNKASTAAALPAAVVPIATDLPPAPEGGWHPEAVEWWRVVWSSPMVGEYTETDRRELMKLLRLEHDFHNAEKPRERLSLLSEIRLQRQCFGLTAMDRRRLNWTVETPKAPAVAKDEDREETDDRDYLREIH